MNPFPPEELQGKDLDSMAIDYYISGLKVDPEHFKCAYNIGFSFFMLQKFKNAVRWFDYALLCRPNSQECQFGRAVCFLRLG